MDTIRNILKETLRLKEDVLHEIELDANVADIVLGDVIEHNPNRMDQKKDPALLSKGKNENQEKIYEYDGNYDTADSKPDGTTHTVDFGKKKRKPAVKKKDIDGMSKIKKYNVGSGDYGGYGDNYDQKPANTVHTMNFNDKGTPAATPVAAKTPAAAPVAAKTPAAAPVAGSASMAASAGSGEGDSDQQIAEPAEPVRGVVTAIDRKNKKYHISQLEFRGRKGDKATWKFNGKSLEVPFAGSSVLKKKDSLFDKTLRIAKKIAGGAAIAAGVAVASKMGADRHMDK